MSKAFQCDRCKNYEADEPICEVTIKLPNVIGGDTPRKPTAHDLCSKCLANLRDFLDYYKNDLNED